MEKGEDFLKADLIQFKEKFNTKLTTMALCGTPCSLWLKNVTTEVTKVTEEYTEMDFH